MRLGSAWTRSAKPTTSLRPEGSRRLMAFVALRSSGSYCTTPWIIPVAPATGLSRLVSVLVHPGWIGVQLFFALSGFLITYGLLEAQGAPEYFRNFYVKRALRILPLYYAVLFALLVVAPRCPHCTGRLDCTARRRCGCSQSTGLTMRPTDLPISGHWPLKSSSISSGPSSSGDSRHGVCSWCCIGIATAALALRSALVLYGADPWTLYINTACRMDALALGAAGACLVRDPALASLGTSSQRPILLLAAALFVAGIPLTHVYDRYRAAGETVGYTLLACVLCSFCRRCLAQPRQCWRRRRCACLGAATLGRQVQLCDVCFPRSSDTSWSASRGSSFTSARTPDTQVVFVYALALLGRELCARLPQLSPAGEAFSEAEKCCSRRAQRRAALAEV